MKFITLSVTLICLLSTLCSSSHSIFEEIKSNKNVIKLQEKIDVLFDPFSEQKNPNPFKIDFPNQKDISPEEYLYITREIKRNRHITIITKTISKERKIYRI